MGAVKKEEIYKVENIRKYIREKKLQLTIISAKASWTGGERLALQTTRLWHSRTLSEDFFDIKKTVHQ